MNPIIKDTEPFIAFVGAGASAIPPSQLPTWFQFNDLLLECLCDGLAAYSNNRQPTDEMLAAFKERRNRTPFFPPDFQAQLMEEEVGADYFHVWQSLETDVYGPVHEGLAELASQGRLSAIITTNFDRLIETALNARGIPFEVFHDAASFNTLQLRSTSAEYPLLPVIKIHGSIEDAASLIDTLKQRVVGRPESLQQTLDIFLRKHPWLFLGFSGADFSYDPNYLGILNAADVAKGFVFLAREGEELQPGVRQLENAYGKDRAAIVYGDLSRWLSETFGLIASKHRPNLANESDDPTQRIKGNIKQWVDKLGPMAMVNILYSMLKSSGLETYAHWLLRKTWKSYRSAAETQGPSYARYNYNYGVSLLEAGFVYNRVSLDTDMNNFAEWKDSADQNAYEYLARSYSTGKLLVAGGQLASLLAYRGEVGKAISLSATVTEDAITGNEKLQFCDIAIASVPIYDMVRVFDPVSLQLQRCLDITRELGDEPRRAMICAHLGRFLTYGGHFDKADDFINEADRIGQRLDLQDVILASQAARGRWLTDSATSDEDAVKLLQQVAATLRAFNDTPLYSKVNLNLPDPRPVQIKGRSPALCRVLLDLNRAAFFAGNNKVINQTLDELDELTIEHFPGYCPHYYLAYAECLLQHGDDKQHRLAADLINRTRLLGESSGNPWPAQAADNLAQHVRLG